MGGSAGAPVAGSSGSAGAASGAAGSETAGAGGSAGEPGVGGDSAGGFGGELVADAGESGAGGEATGSGGEPAGESGAGGEAGTPVVCECSDGECCDGCHFRPSSHFLREVVVRSACAGEPPDVCGVDRHGIVRDIANQFCAGIDATQTRTGPAFKSTASDCHIEVDGYCVTDTVNTAHCAPCP